ncbi:MAG: hypothetical protein EBT93_04530 [Alphaproteobacteria bacterium]|nr:hypothetical protein [Alphaproteobacteria bacterium]
MNTGKNFSAVKSVYYDNGTYDGVADIALEADPTSGANVALLKDSNRSGLVFYTGIAAIKDANTIAYTYRNYRTDQQIASNGTLTFSTSAIITRLEKRPEKREILSIRFEIKPNKNFQFIIESPAHQNKGLSPLIL